LTIATVDIAIVGAGPYGLSLAAHLAGKRSVRIFGPPMRAWSHHMPHGMHLKSEGFASNLYDPQDRFTLEAYCAERAIPYAHIGLPVPIQVFIDYGVEFQKRYVPNLENVEITSVKRAAGGFELTTSSGEVAKARQVVIATGIVDFAFLPPQLAPLPASMLSHSSQHADLSGFKGSKVAVLGAGASAVDIAALLVAVGADVELVARRQAIQFHRPPNEPRPLWTRLKAPRSGLGTGWRSRFCTDIPLVFHAMPESLRIRAVMRHLGPAPGWFVRAAVEGHVPMHLGVKIGGASAHGRRAQLALERNGTKQQIEVDHVIAATGYRVATERLGFLDPSIRSDVRNADEAPVLNRHFESSVPGLYFIGTSAANSFGPLLRFAYGANFTAKRVAARLMRG
jgi:thioredoxin reductase